MSYENPQKIVNRTWDIFAKMTQENNNRIAANVGEAMKNMKRKKEYNKLALQQIENEKLNFASKLDSIDTSESGKAFDDNLRMFFDSQVDKYFDIKNAMRKGDMDKREGTRILGNMDRQVTKFQAMLPEILTIASTIKDQAGTATKQGGISTGTTPKEIIDIFGTIAGGGNVYTVEDPKTGNLWLMKLPKPIESKYLEDGTVNETELLGSFNTHREDGTWDGGGALVNLDEVMKLGPKNMVQYTTNLDAYSKPLAKNLLNEDDINNGFYQQNMTYETQGDKTIEKSSIYMTANDANRMKEKVKTIRGYKTMLDDNKAMKSVWVDLMDRDTDWTGEAWQRDAAEDWMIEDGITKLLIRQGLIKTKEVNGELVADLNPNAKGSLLDRLQYVPKEEAMVQSQQAIDVGELTETEKSSILTNLPKVKKSMKHLLTTYKDDGDADNSLYSKKRFANKVADELNAMVGGQDNSAKTWQWTKDMKEGTIKRGDTIYELFDTDGGVKEEMILQLLASRSGLGEKTAYKLATHYNEFVDEDEQITEIDYLPNP